MSCALVRLLYPQIAMRITPESTLEQQRLFTHQSALLDLLGDDITVTVDHPEAGSLPITLQRVELQDSAHDATAETLQH